VGLLKTGLKAVVAVKTADVIHERILERQAAQWGPQGPPVGPPPQTPHSQALPPQAPSAPPAVGSGDDIIDKLTKLADLKAAGVLNDAEFDTQKARILAAAT